MFRPPSNYGSNHSIPPRPEPIAPTATNSTMLPNEEDKVGGDGYGSSKIQQSNWRLMGLGKEHLSNQRESY